MGWFFSGNTADRIILAGSFTPALRDGADCISSVTGAEAPAYFLSVPPGRRCRASIYVLSPKFIVDVWRLACSLKKNLLRRKRHFFAAQPTKKRSPLCE